MKIQVLVAAMHQEDHSLLEKMNIQTDAIVANQCSNNSVEKFKYNESEITYLNFAEKGVGLNRNNALMRADADVVLFADDDIVYENNYKEIIESEFAKHKDADMIVFNVKNEDDRPRYTITSSKRVHKYNCLRYGAVRIAVKLDSIRKNNIWFSLLFGGGTKYGSGEDSLFIYDCISCGMKAYTSSEVILTVPQSNSTWFDGYTAKYFYDKGALYRAIFGKKASLMILLFLFKNKKETANIGIRAAYLQMRNGNNDF